jgi:hypothetical protein
MGLLSFFSKTRKTHLERLPAGSFTLDREGRLLTSTLPQSFPSEQIELIGRRVLGAFRAAQKAQMPLVEVIVHYATLKMLARELRGGAIVFLMPQTLTKNAAKS